MINKDNSLSSKIVLSCKKEGKRTLLVNSFFDVPYKIVHYGSRLLHDHLEIMLMCYSPGVMDGDSLDLNVHCSAGTEMKLFTQSFNKLHAMKNGSKQAATIKVEENAIFQFLPQPMIPFRKSIFDSSSDIHLNDSSHLIWGDIISGGRIHSGEKFEFTSVHCRTRIFRNNKLVFFDNLLLQPQKQPLSNLLFFGGYTHQGMLLIASPYARAFKQELDELLSEQFTDMVYGFTECGQNEILIRALGESGYAMHEWFGNVGNMCWSFIQHHKDVEARKKVTAIPLQPAIKNITLNGKRVSKAKKTPAKQKLERKLKS